MSSLLDLPLEVLYAIAQFDSDLLALGGLLFSCKSMNELLQNDLRLQKIFFNNTPASLKSTTGTAIRRRFIEWKTKRAIIANDREGIPLIFPILTTDEIIKVLRFYGNSINRRIYQLDILYDIYNADADRVLEYIIKTAIECAQPERKKRAIIDLLALIFGSFIDKFEMSKKTAALYIETIRRKKVISMLMKHLHEHQEVIFSSLLVSTHTYSHQMFWATSNIPSNEALVCLFLLFAAFPQYKFDLSLPIKSDDWPSLTPGFAIPPLELCVAIGALQSFKLLLKYGVKFDKDAPYLPVALLQNQLSGSMFVKELISEYKCDINCPLPAYVGATRPTTILGHILSTIMAKKWPLYQTFCFLEYLLNNGATLLKEEEQGFLNLKPTHWAYKVVKLLKDKENGACQGDIKLDFGRPQDITALSAQLHSLQQQKYTNLEEANAYREEIIKFREALYTLEVETIMIVTTASKVKLFVAESLNEVKKLKKECAIYVKVLQTSQI
jgi:hypothetical protein